MIGNNAVPVGGGGSGEPPLGNPTADGMVLVSTAAGARSWRRLPKVFTVTDDDARLALDPTDLVVNDIVKQTALTQNPTNPSEWEHAVYGVVDPGNTIPGNRFVHYGTYQRPPVNTGLPTVSAPYVGSACVAFPGTWNDTPEFTYQWQIEHESGWVDMTGETARTYVPLSADVGGRLRVIVTATNAIGSTTATSAASETVVELTLTNGLLSYWSMDEDGGNTRTDQSGNGNDLYENNTCDSTVGKIGQAAVFNNSCLYSQFSLIPTGDFTFAFWYKTQVEDGNDVAAFYDFQRTFGGNITQGRILGSIGQGGWDITENMDFTDWSHVAFVVAGTTCRLFLNGVMVQTVDTGDRTPESYWANQPSFYLGGRPDGYYNYDTSMDEVGIWSRGLSNNEIGALYNQGLGLNPTA